MLKCTWCMKETETAPCDKCGSDLVVDPSARHTCEWGRQDVDTMKCKVCGKEITTEEYFKGGKE